MSDPVSEPLRRRTKVLLVLAALVVIALIAATLVAWRRHVEAMKPRALPPSSTCVGALAFTPDGRSLLALTIPRDGAATQSIARWSEPDGALLSTTILDEGMFVGLAVSPRGDHVACVSLGGKVLPLSLPGLTRLDWTLRVGTVRGRNNGVMDTAVHYSASGGRVALNDSFSGLQVWSLPDGARPVLIPDAPDSDCRRVLGFVSEDQVAFVASGAIKVWSISKEVVELEVPTSVEEPASYVVSPRTTHWIAAPWSDKPTTATVHRLPRGEPLGPPVIVPAHAVVVFSPDDALLAIASAESLTVQSVATGSVAFTQPLPGEKDAVVTAVAFSPVVNRVAVACGTKVFVFPFQR